MRTLMAGAADSMGVSARQRARQGFTVGSLTRIALERQAQSELQASRKNGRGVLAEGRVYLRAFRIELCAGADGAELRMVEQVVRLRAKLHPPALAVNRNVLEHRHVPVVEPRSAEHVFGRIAPGPHRQRPKGIDVEGMAEIALIFRKHW